MSDLLSFIGLAKKAGCLQIGEEPVAAAARSHSARLLLVASDAAENTLRRTKRIAENGKMVLFRVPYTKEELGGGTGRGSCAVLALTEIGFASSLADKLEAQDPAQYSAGAAELRSQLQRFKNRQAEKRRHEAAHKPGKRAPGKKQ